MTAPNIVSATSVIALTKLLPLTTVNETVLFNSSGSNKLYKVSSLLVANKSQAPAAVTVTMTVVEDGDMNFLAEIAHEIVVPVNATLAVINRNTPIYIQEDAALLASASVDSALDLVCAYEEVM